MPLPVLTPAQAASWDAASEAAGIATAVLMASAGRALATVIADRFPAACRQGVLVAAGPGNNGGDGWVLARALHAVGIPVWVAAVPATLSPLNQAAAGQARADGVREVSPEGPWPAAGLLVDALLGTGARGAPRPPVAGLVERLADLDLPLVAVDGPTGLDLADGVSHGPLQARLTITFGGYRRGHLLARDECGDLVVADIGLAPPDPRWPVLLTREMADQLTPPVPARAHKGTRGRVVIMGGDAGMSGAARLAGRAAFAAGAGLVHVIAPADSVAVIAGAEPDLQTLAQSFDAPLGAEARGLLARADAVVIGPGLGRTESRRARVLEAAGAAAALVLDADGLMALAGDLDPLVATLRGKPLVLTPHLGEFRALFPALAAGAAVDPWGAAEDAAAATGATLLLKGVPSVVAGAGRATWTVAAGNPGLATGGSGDCLAGFLGTFLAQGVGPRDAAALAAQLLGDAADLAARSAGVRALRPMDVVAALPALGRESELRRRLGPVLRPPILHELPLPRPR